MKKADYKQFYMYLISEGVIEEPYDEESFDQYLFEDYKEERLNILDVVGRSEQFYCMNNKGTGRDEMRCQSQCKSCKQ